jgi:5,10-methylenetetrahydromethanopterin reductase
MLEISCAFATSLDTSEHVRTAEELGYRRAWLYDSPALYPDVWVTLALAAERTSRIGLGPACWCRACGTRWRTQPPSRSSGTWRWPGAGGRRSGFTGRMTFGQRPLPWKYVRAYVAALKGLLRGEKVEWEAA